MRRLEACIDAHVSELPATRGGCAGLLCAGSANTRAVQASSPRFRPEPEPCRCPSRPRPLGRLTGRESGGACVGPRPRSGGRGQRPQILADSADRRSTRSPSGGLQAELGVNGLHNLPPVLACSSRKFSSSLSWARASGEKSARGGVMQRAALRAVKWARTSSAGIEREGSARVASAIGTATSRSHCSTSGSLRTASSSVRGGEDRWGPRRPGSRTHRNPLACSRRLPPRRARRASPDHPRARLRAHSHDTWDF